MCFPFILAQNYQVIEMIYSKSQDVFLLPKNTIYRGQSTIIYSKIIIFLVEVSCGVT